MGKCYQGHCYANMLSVITAGGKKETLNSKFKEQNRSFDEKEK